MNTGLGKARALGVPRSDIERVARHYSISESEAERYLRIHPVEELIPGRGYGLTTGRGAGSLENEVPQVSGCWPFLLVGGVMGGILGVGFAIILQKGERG